MNEYVAKLLKQKVSPIRYAILLREINLAVQERFSDRLQDITGLFEKYKISLNTPGSDGRLEKGSAIASPAEFIIFSHQRLLDKDKKDIVQSILNICGRKHLFEFKILDGTEQVYKFNSIKVQPARVLDARPLWDVYGMRRAALDVWCHQVKSAPRKDIVSKTDALRRDAVRVCNTGKNSLRKKERVHFSIVNDVEGNSRVTLYYIPDKFRISAKPGPLRLVQNTVLLKIIKYVRGNDSIVKAAEFMYKYPFNTLARLDYLFVNGVFNTERSVINEVKEHYAFMLRLYHLSEYLYEIEYDSKLGLEGVALDHKTSDEFTRRLNEILKITKELMR